MDKKILEKVYDRIINGNTFSLKTGFDDLDLILSGIDTGSVVTVGGRPAMGKTGFITSLLINLLKQNKKCLFYSLELTSSELLTRIIGNMSEISTRELFHSENLTNKDTEKLKNTFNSLTDLDLTIIDELPNVEDMKETIEKEKPEFVFIDYLQLLHKKSKRTRCEILNDILTELKQIAKENDCIIFITSQLSRALEARIDKRPMLSDLRESGGIEEISDAVLLLYRGEYYNSNDEDYTYNKGIAEIIVAKNKFGPTGTVELRFEPRYVKFYNREASVYVF